MTASSGVARCVALAVIACAGTAAAADWHRVSEGDRVEVECELRGDTPVAREIDVRSERGRGTAEIVALLGDVGPDGIVVLDTRVAVGAGTRIKAESGDLIGIGDLVPGTWVEVDADVTRERLLARRIKVLPADQDRWTEVEGPVGSVDRDEQILVVAGVRIAMNRKVQVRGLPVYVPRVIDDDDVDSAFLSGLDGNLLVGGRLVGSVQPERNFDLNTARDGDLVTSDWAMELQADTRLTRYLDAFGKASFQGTRILHDGEGDELDTTDWRLQQAWVLWRPVRRLAVQVGRQDFDEQREWLFDQNLDGVRAYLQTGAVRTELSVSTRWNTQSRSLRDWTNFMALSGREVARAWDVEIYGIHRRRTATDERPLWLGIRSRGRITSALRHWVEMASLTGRLDGRERRAWAFDTGLRIRLERRTRASITAGWAVGSGGDAPGDEFRQTGFQDNNDKFAGVSSFRYYGELLEPELANLSVRTAGLGLRPSRRTSVDVIYHDYTQRRADPAIRSNLQSRPRGTSPDIGREWDLVLALEEIPRVDIEYVLARFLPGDAFDPAAEPATFHKLSIQYGF